MNNKISKFIFFDPKYAISFSKYFFKIQQTKIRIINIVSSLVSVTKLIVKIIAIIPIYSGRDNINFFKAMYAKIKQNTLAAKSVGYNAPSEYRKTGLADLPTSIFGIRLKIEDNMVTVITELTARINVFNIFLNSIPSAPNIKIV